MLASKQLRENLDHVVEQLNRRDYSFDVEAFKALEAKRKVAQIETQELQNLRNTRSKAIGQAKAAGEDIKPLLDEVSNCCIQRRHHTCIGSPPGRQGECKKYSSRNTDRSVAI